MTLEVSQQLRVFEQNDTDKLYHIAQQLFNKGTFEYYLNSQQLLVLSSIFNNKNDPKTLFTSFINSNVYLKFTEPIIGEVEEKEPSSPEESEKKEKPEEEEPNNNIIVNEQTIPDGIESSRQLALRVRYILYDRAIDLHFDDGSNTDNYELFEEDDDDKNEEKVQIKEPVRKLDDDYDEENYDDDEEEKDEKSPKNDEINGEASEIKPLEYDEDGFIILEVPISQSESTQLDNKTLIENFNKIYHNFENDKETIIKRKKLEENDKLLEEHDENLSLKDSFMNLGAANLSLKHLLRSIDDNKEKLNLQDNELRQLIMDVRKNRSKWASDDKVGQEELYEACEKVVMELRNYTEHSTAFLNKVSKREAPNYAQIIKNPMDLNTILKKLKAFQYKSKQEFVDDVLIIWKNCLTYNSDPRHFLRAHAIAMQKKSMILLPLIPDITIRDRSEVEAENLIEETSTPGPSGKSTSKKGKKRSRNGEIKIEPDSQSDLNGTESSIVPSDAGSTPIPTTENNSSILQNNIPPPPSASSVLENESMSEASVKANGVLGESTELEEEEDGDSNDYLKNEENNDKDDFELNNWKSITSKTRAELCMKRSDLFDSNFSLNGESSAILRDSKKMSKFDSYLKNYSDTKKKVFRPSHISKNDDDIYLIEYDIAGGYPSIVYKGKSDLDIDEEESKLLDEILANGGNQEQSQFATKNGGLDKVINGNIHEMQEIRRICFKISIIRQMQQQQFLHHSQLKPPEIEEINDTYDLDPISKLPTHDTMNKDLIYSIMKKKVSKIAMQSGFESTELIAIDSLTQIAGNYLNNLIATIKTHLETPSINAQQKSKSILHLSLLENGINRPDELYSYVHENVLRQNLKLKDLRSKLSLFLKTLLRPVFERTEKTFEDNSDQFVSGDFSNELGDDFFGFKELGLDKELGIIGNSIPLHLLHSRFAEANQQDDPKKIKRQEFESKPFKRLTDEDIPNQVKTFQPYLESELMRTKQLHSKQIKSKKEVAEYLANAKGVTILDDEDYPKRQQRPKLPPTGKITPAKKKITASTFFLPE